MGPLPPASDVVARLRAAGCVAAEDEARQLLGASSDDAGLELLVRRREQGEPLAWITGMTEFCGHDLHVAPGVYVPRPHTEELARRAAAVLPGHGRAADLCTGSGAIAVHLRATVPTASVVGVDSDPAAVECARHNGVDTVLGDLDARELETGSFDVVTSVPPYVPAEELRFLPPDIQRWEPRAALDGGGDGLAVARRVVTAAARLLRERGWLLIEVGGGQDAALASQLAGCGFDRSRAWRDDDGDLRGIAAQMARD